MRKNQSFKTKVIICSALVVFAGLAVLFGIYDLQITLALYNPHSIWASAFEQGGRIAAPIIIAAALNFASWNRYLNRRVKWYIVVDIIIMLIAIFIILSYCGGFPGWGQEIIVGGIYFFLNYLIHFKIRRLDHNQRKELVKIVAMMIVAALIMLLTVEALKNLAGRPRFRNFKDLSEFSPWYRWNPFSGGRSFPSGHTANSCAIIGISFAAQLFKDKWKRVVIGALPIIYLLIMAVSRVVMGAHFASDVLFSLGLAALIWFVVYKLFAYRKAKRRW